MRKIGFLLGALWASTLPAALYKCFDEQANVVFTDMPCVGGEEIQLPPGTTYTPRLPPAVGAGKEAAPEDSGVVEYSRFRILRPGPDGTVRDTVGTVQVELDLQPPLQGDDRIAVSLDGVRLSPTGTATVITLNNVDRGTHTVQARVVSPEGRTRIVAEAVTFHLHRAENLPREQAPTKAFSAPASPRAPRTF